MKSLRWHDNPQGLEPLAAQATDYALHMMKTTGSVPPTTIAVTDEGLIFCMPDDLANEAAKDRFAEVARLLATAYAEKEVAIAAVNQGKVLRILCENGQAVEFGQPLFIVE